MDITDEITIVIPIRIDSKERNDNLESILFYLSHYTSAKIIILEADEKQNFFLKTLNDRIRYYFRKDADWIFHHTKYRNELIDLSDNNIVAIWDADVFLNLYQLMKGIELIKKGISMCIPYDGRAFYLDSKESIKARDNILYYVSNYKEGVLVPILGRPSVGGIFIVNKKRFLQLGGENEKLYGWGPEDAEHLKRMEILEEQVERIQGPLFHLHHPRGINSTSGHSERDRNNLNEFIKICKMSKKELQVYMNTWNMPKM